ncbi:MAG: DUF885 family protein [Chthoniobacteraceae bacterium]
MQTHSQRLPFRRPRTVSLCAAVLAFVSSANCALADDVAAKKPEPARAAETAKFQEALASMTREYLKSQPETATTLAIPPEEAGGKYSDRLADRSEAEAVRTTTAMKAWLTAFENVDATLLSDSDRISLEVVKTAVANGLGTAEFAWGNTGFNPSPYVVNQIDCAFTAIPDFLDSRHPLKSAEDATDYLKRLSGYAVVLDQESARIEADAERGVIPPDFVVDGAIKQLATFAAFKPTETVLVSSLARGVKDISKIDALAAADLVARAEQITAEEILPAYRRQIAALEAVRSKAPHEPGIWRVDGGDKYYAACLKTSTTTDLTPDQVHEMGLQLVARFSAEADPLLKSLGYDEGTVGERLRALSTDERQLYPNDDAGRAQLLDDLNKQTAAISAKLPLYFGALAKAQVEIKRVPAYIEAGAPGGYYQSAALDGSRPGAYYINLRNTAEWPRFSLPTLTYHEAIPGHHWQISIAQESKSLPLIRSALLGFVGYTEGWALYAEQLADEIGAYQDDPAGRLGYLQSMLFRAARLVVDTGIHHRKWTRDQAIDYMVSVTGDQRSSIATEVERYAVWPGQACGYMVGREEINRLREKARTALGAKFDLKSFHDVILTNGALPLTVLARLVDQWIAAQDPSPVKQAAVRKTKGVAPELIAAAEQVIGLEFTEQERAMMAGDLAEARHGYELLRNEKFPNDLAPAFLFNPLPMGFQIEKDDHPPVWEPAKNFQRPAREEDLAFATVAELAALIRSGQITSEELTRFSLDRLKKYGPRLHCVITLTEELAIEQAKRADAELRAGKWRGPLHGIPYAAKDLFDTRGIATTWGVAVNANRLPNTDATIIRKLEEAGAVLVAKTSLGELAMGDVWHGGLTRNPWNPKEGSSGSSAGSAASVAAGLVPFAIGTETLGSIVSPSHVCGVTGLRPSFGRVSRAGAMALCWSLDKVGPLARSVEDCGLVFNAMRGADPADPSAIDAAFRFTEKKKNLRVGIVKSDFGSGDPNRTNDLATLAVLRGCGFQLRELEWPQTPTDPLILILQAEAAAAFDEWTRSGQDDQLVQQAASSWPNSFRAARFIPAVEYLQAMRLRSRLIEEMAKLFEEVDVIVAPPWVGNQLLATNMTGHPCVIVPNGDKTGGKAASICFIGRLFGEADAVQVAAAYQDATAFHRQRPPLETLLK